MGRHIAALADLITTAPRQLQALQDAARVHDADLEIHTAGTPEAISPAIDAAEVSGAAVLSALASPVLFANRPLIFERATGLRLPALYQWPEMAREAGVAGYGPSDRPALPGRIEPTARQVF